MAKHKRPFEINTTYSGHSGIDYPYPSWTPILATGAGYISARGSNQGGGYYCWVTYDDGQVEGSFHCPDNSGPRQGTRVTEGQVVAYVGNTGNSTGPHLHHQVENPRGVAHPPSGYWNHVEQGAGGYVGGGGTTPPPTPPQEDDDMAYRIYQNGGRIMILGPETFLELGDGLTKKTGVDGAETLALYQSLPGTLTVQLDARQYDVLRVNTAASG